MRKVIAKANELTKKFSKEDVRDAMDSLFKEYGFVPFDDKRSRVETLSYILSATGEKIIGTLLNNVQNESWTFITIKEGAKAVAILSDIKRFFVGNDYSVDGPKEFRPGRLNLK